MIVVLLVLRATWHDNDCGEIASLRDLPRPLNQVLTHTFLILTCREILPTEWAFRSRKVNSSLSPPPSLFAALLDFRPSTLRVVELPGFVCREPLVERAEASIPLAMREEMLPLPPFVRTFCMMC
jgi:hypothetical protein